MATVRSTGDVITASVWNAVLAQLTDDGGTYSGAFNGSTVAGTTGSFSSTLAVTGATTLSGATTVNAAAARGVVITRAGADVGLQLESSGGSGKAYAITSQTTGILSIQDDGDATPRIELSGNNVNLVATDGVTNANYYNSATAPGSWSGSGTDGRPVAWRMSSTGRVTRVRAEMADEVDKGQARGDVARREDTLRQGPDVRGLDNGTTTLDDLGLDRRRLAEWPRAGRARGLYWLFSRVVAMR